jgi:CzcA family heavy metal efflux pump
MTRGLIAWSLRFRLLMIPIAAAVMFLGITQMRSAPADVLPEFTPAYVEIQTEALGLSPTEVEQLITVPIEEELLNGVAGIDVIRSESAPSLSSVTLVFEPGTNLSDARQLVQERLIRANLLPAVSRPPAMLQPLSTSSRVMMIGLSSRTLPLTEVSVLARWAIRPRLLGVPGVANVVMWGQREHQLQVQVDPQRLRARGVTLAQVIKTTGNAQLVSPLTFLEASTPGTGGFIDSPNQRLQVRHILPIAAPEGLARVPVDGSAGGALRLGDVAQVLVDHQPLIGDAVVGGAPGLMLVVEKLPGANTLEVTRGVEKALDALRPGLSGIDIDQAVYRPVSFIESAIDNLTVALLVGGLLVALMMLALLFEWRTALIGLVSIALSVATAGLVLVLLGQTMNALVLAGLALAVGVVVDDAVTGVENVWRRLRERRAAGSDEPADDIVVAAAAELRGPLAYATLVVLAAVAPILAMGGAPGALLQPLALAFAVAVVASLVVALTVTPALCAILLRGASLERRDPPLLRGLRRGYAALLAPLLRLPTLVFAGAGAAALVGLALIATLSLSLLPTFKERDVLVHLEGPPGTSHPEMSRITALASQEIRAIPGVRNVGAHVGRAVMSDRIVGVNSSTLWVSLDEGADHDRTVGSLRALLAEYPGLREDVLTYSRDRMRAIGALRGGSGAAAEDDGLGVLSGVNRPVVVRLYGKDFADLHTRAEAVARALAGVSGVVDARVERQVQEPTLEIETNLVAARQHGIKPGDVRRAAATLLSGIVVGSLFEAQKVFDVVVMGVPETRHSPDGIRQLLIDTPSGGRVPLGEVADVRIAPSPSVIRREAASRYVDVSAGVNGRDAGDVRDEIEERLELIAFSSESHAQVFGESTSREIDAVRLLGFAIAAAIAAFLLLQAAFGSWGFAALVMASLPVALVGGLVAALIAGGTITIGALAGFLLVLGIAVRTGVALIGRLQALERDEGRERGPGLVLEAAQERLPAVVMTTAAIALAALSVIVRGDAPGFELLRPMAIVALGGLVTAALSTLFLVPALYLRFAPRPRPTAPLPRGGGEPVAG